MQKINLKKIVETSPMSKKEIAAQLFPSNKFPVLALNRVMAGEAELEASQISKLSVLMDIPIDKLFREWTWKSKNEVHTFYDGDYVAELNTHTWTAKLFHKNSLFHEEYITNRNIVLSEFLNFINNQIKKHEPNQN